MFEKKAVIAYTQERMNCAQSVFKAFQETHGVSNEIIAQARSKGGGCAEKGLCGALYAAIQLTAPKHELIKSEFEKVTGSDTCMGIRNGSKYSCRDCVALAARLVQATIHTS